MLKLYYVHYSNYFDFRKSWFLRSLKKCSIRRKKNKNHTMTTPEESYELSNVCQL